MITWERSPYLSLSFLYSNSPPPTSTLANFIKNLAQQAKNVPRFLPDNFLLSTSAWTSKGGVQAAGRLDRRADNMDPTPESKPDKQEKQERSYLSAAVESMTWGGSRSSTPKPTSAALPGEASGLKNQYGGYQSTHQWHGLSSKRYPSDCPPLNPRWFYAVDVSPLVQSMYS
jgi:hypothetical protein